MTVFVAQTVQCGTVGELLNAELECLLWSILKQFAFGAEENHEVSLSV